MVMDSPCHGCTAETGRSATCHGAGNCQRHDEWKARHEKEREETRKRKATDRMLRSYYSELSSVLKKGDHR